MSYLNYLINVKNDENHLIFVLIHLSLALFAYFQKTYVFITVLKPSSQLCFTVLHELAKLTKNQSKLKATTKYCYCIW